MPVYLLHGFRWPRDAIGIYVEKHNIEDAAADYICSPGTSAALHAHLSSLYPELISSLPSLRFIEQRNPEITTGSTIQPFAFVADKIETCHLSVDVGVTIGHGVSTESWGALVELRDQLAPKEKVGWWVVYSGDEERSVSDSGEGNEEDEAMVFPDCYANRDESLMSSRCSLNHRLLLQGPRNQREV